MVVRRHGAPLDALLVQFARYVLWACVVDPGSAVDRGDPGTPDQPRSLNPPRCLHVPRDVRQVMIPTRLLLLGPRFCWLTGVLGDQGDEVEGDLLGVGHGVER